MNTHSRKPQVLTVRELIQGNYEIPPYQRAYAWGEAEITTFLKDIRDARGRSESESSGYYIGSLVLNSEPANAKGPYTVVDGQQRLTTLFIILALYFSDEADFEITYDTLTFAARPDAQRDIENLRRAGGDAIDRLSTDGLRHATTLIRAAQDRGKLASAENSERLDEAVFSDNDLRYLLDKVRILRTELPPNTDLNHYFEIMNTRGEQLEKHEILKARLLNELGNFEERRIFSRIWDACSVLDSHIQNQFSPTETDNKKAENKSGTTKNEGGKSERRAIFGKDSNNFSHANEADLFKAMRETFPKGNTNTDVREPDQTISLNALLKDHKRSTQDEHTKDESGAYQSIIDFPNLLLHVLKILKNEKHSWGSDAAARSEQRGVPLEDKYLLAEFGDLVKNEDNAADKIRRFAFLLLKTRFLMDRYVICTQPGIAGDDIENWVIHHAHKEDMPLQTESISNNAECTDGRRVLMLQAMFQVSDPRRASKYFLFQIFDWLHSQESPESVDPECFANFLEHSMTSRLKALKFQDICNRGRAVPNFLFNALDYCLWRQGVCPSGKKFTFLNVDEKDLSEAARAFHFRYRTSVEHFYPVNPSESDGHKRLKNIDDFGNLSIMSRSDNARRSNLMPAAKVEQFQSSAQSLKFQLMASAARKNQWEEGQIDQHGEEMLAVLVDAVENLGQ